MRVEIMDCSCGYSVRRSANRKSGHLLGGQAYYSIMSICFLSRRSAVKSDSSYSFQFNKMARPAGLEPAPFCLEVTGPRYAGQAGKELSLSWWCDNLVGSMRAGK